MRLKIISKHKVSIFVFFIHIFSHKLIIFILIFCISHSQYPSFEKYEMYTLKEKSWTNYQTSAVALLFAEQPGQTSALIQYIFYL